MSDHVRVAVQELENYVESTIRRSVRRKVAAAYATLTLILGVAAGVLGYLQGRNLALDNQEALVDQRVQGLKDSQALQERIDRSLAEFTAKFDTARKHAESAANVAMQALGSAEATRTQAIRVNALAEEFLTEADSLRAFLKQLSDAREHIADALLANQQFSDEVARKSLSIAESRVADELEAVKAELVRMEGQREEWRRHLPIVRRVADGDVVPFPAGTGAQDWDVFIVPVLDRQETNTRWFALFRADLRTSLTDRGWKVVASYTYRSSTTADYNHNPGSAILLLMPKVQS